MVETASISWLLLPEIEDELVKTRRTLELLPDGQLDYKPHERSMSFGRLAGHLAEIPGYGVLILNSTSPVSLTPETYHPLHMESRVQLLAAYNEVADGVLTLVKNTTDQVFDQEWKLIFHGHPAFSGTRYTALRSLCLNQMIHHRAQLGVYLRLLNHPVPGMYGPSADDRAAAQQA